MSATVYRSRIVRRLALWILALGVTLHHRPAQTNPLTDPTQTFLAIECLPPRSNRLAAILTENAFPSQRKMIVEPSEPWRRRQDEAKVRIVSRGIVELRDDCFEERTSDDGRSCLPHYSSSSSRLESVYTLTPS